MTQPLVAILLLLVAMTDAVLAAERIARYREPPYGACRFVQEQFGATPEPFQEETLVAFASTRPEHRRISLQACAGPGKTAVMAWCGWYFLGTQCTPGEHPKGLCTSITGENLRDNLWAEFSKWQERSPYLSHAFTWTNQRIAARDHPETWFFSPRKWPKTGNADEQGATFSGLHSQNVCVLIDESGAIPSTVMRAAEQALGNTTFGKVMQGGNTLSTQGMLYEAATLRRHLWHVIAVNGDPDNPKRASRVDLAWAREQIDTYGRQNPWVMAYILGQFPPSNLNTLLGIEDVQTAMARVVRPDQYDHMQKRIGVDVARFGDDRTVLFPRQGIKAFRPVVLRQQRTTDIAARVMRARERWSSELELVDDTGHWGHGVIDNLIAAGLSPHPVVFHAPAIDQKRFKNRRAEMWITMADAVRGGLALPNLPELIPELTTPTYTFLNGVFQLEDKAITKQLLGRSPDLADGLALTYALPDLPASVGALTGTRGRALTDWDPYAGAAR